MSGAGAGAARRQTAIKICGVTSPHIAEIAVEAGAAAIGLVFVPASPRLVTADQASAIARVLPPHVAAVGVFANQSRAEIDVFLHRTFGTARGGASWLGGGNVWVQLHGEESEELAASLPAPVIKAVPFDERAIARWCACTEASVRALLVDGPAGGSGVPFEHAALAALAPRLSRPLIMAGGLTADNVGDAIRAVRPHAVDVSSGVESARGRKDPGLIRSFCAAVRAAVEEEKVESGEKKAEEEKNESQATDEQNTTEKNTTETQRTQRRTEKKKTRKE